MREGRNFINDVGVGDLWYFPPGLPHSIQGLGPDGCEFLLVFDDGAFSEDNTFLLSDWFVHTPPEVLAKNFGVPAASFAQHARPRPALHLRRQGPPTLKARSHQRGDADAARLHAPHAGAEANPHQERRGTHHQFEELPRRHGDLGGARRGPTRRHARTALAPQCRRVAVLHRGARPHGRVRLHRQRADLRLSRRRRRLRPVRHGPLRREHGRRGRCASSRCSRARAMPTCRSTSGWR